MSVLNPQLMENQADMAKFFEDRNFSIESETQIVKIGFSEEYTYCKEEFLPEFTSKSLGLFELTNMKSIPCLHFTNNSIESACELHKRVKIIEKTLKILFQGRNSD